MVFFIQVLVGADAGLNPFVYYKIKFEDNETDKNVHLFIGRIIYSVICIVVGVRAFCITCVCVNFSFVYMQVLGGRGCTTAAIAAAFTTVLVHEV